MFSVVNQEWIFRIWILFSFKNSKYRFNLWIVIVEQNHYIFSGFKYEYITHVDKDNSLEITYFYNGWRGDEKRLVCLWSVDPEHEKR